MKPLLLGMNNPLSDDPGFDLFPYPENSTGWRLWKMLPDGTPRQVYMGSFDRVNLLRSRTWSKSDADVAAQALIPSLQGRLVAVLGSDVRAALGLVRTEPLSRQEVTILVGAHEVTFEWIAVPHPSGRNYWYTQPANKAAVRTLLADLLEASRG